jgi:hypothetical protein
MPFQFNHLLTSNAPPDDSDALQMEAICTACKQELAATDSTESEMAVLKAALTDQRKARMDVEERLAKYKALLSLFVVFPSNFFSGYSYFAENHFPKCMRKIYTRREYIYILTVLRIANILLYRLGREC